MIRIALVDDHPVVRAGLVALLDAAEDIEVVGQGHDAQSALQLVSEQAPDVVLMDLHLGSGPGGIETTRSLRALPNPPQVLVLTTYDTESDILKSLEAGALGYLLKDTPPAQLFAAVRSVARGETVLAPLAAATLVKRNANSAPQITAREVDVLELLAEGKSNKEIAKSLFVSEGTVKSHLAHIYAKLQTDSRAGAVAAAIAQRIIRRA
ncbi:DNA-binding response regulator [Arthrobacter sp. MYb211]|uniref:response regulator n=1 Tax=Micrococcaceae TaxID=1268 RepID=UPI000CFDFB39|nr:MULTISPECIES: response regulator transcription factor [unclassified Arthrobacter]PRA10601.1 DNA-binding response regulator [Arthrobacter sp. MYb221]PRC06289.1 DNA-binding response regulator [Arthrobacter sp. MYb211]